MNITLSRAWLILLGLQALVALAVFSSFFSGQAYFAYLDIGSDSYGQVLPDAMHMACKLASEGFTGWSFELGLGGPTNFLVGDVFSLMGMLGGPDAVLPLRIWVYVLKNHARRFRIPAVDPLLRDALGNRRNYRAGLFVLRLYRG